MPEYSSFEFKKALAENAGLPSRSAQNTSQNWETGFGSSWGSLSTSLDVLFTGKGKSTPALEF